MQLAVLGNHPQLSLAELERVHGEARQHSPDTAVFSGGAYMHLGGSSRTGTVVKRLPTTKLEEVFDYLSEGLPSDLDLPRQKISLGVSVYGVRARNYRQQVFSLKKHLREYGYKPRFILGKKQQLSSAQVIHNSLTGKGYDILISVGPRDTVVARGDFVQDIESYTHRDMDRPVRDMKVGMLPPKLAQVMLNLAGGNYIYDPFCGTGVVLQEALLMGKQASGSDISDKMVTATERNLEWLANSYDTEKPDSLTVQDAKTVKLPRGIDSIVSEIYLGPVIGSQLPESKLRSLAAEASELIEKSLANWHGQIDTGTVVCLAVPIWKNSSGDIMPSLAKSIDDLTGLGYNQVRFSRLKASDLTYRRPDQYVGRRLLLLERI